MESNLPKSDGDIQMDTMEDAPPELLCHIMVGTVKVTPKRAGKLLDVTNALRQAGIRRDFVVKLNDSGLTFDEIANNLDRTNELTTLK